MTVKEFIQSLDKEKLIKEYLNYEGKYLNIFLKDSISDSEKFINIKEAEQNISKFIDELLSIEPKENTESNIVYSLPCDFKSYILDSFLIKKEDIIKGEQENYAYELSNIDEILGWDISSACKHFLDDDYRYASSILFEISFFGYDIKSRNEEVDKTNSDIEEAIKDIGLNGASYKSKSFEKMCEELGFVDKRTDNEKEFDLQTSYIEREYFNNLKKELIKLDMFYLNI